RRQITLGFEPAKLVNRFEQSQEQCFQRVARADYPRRNPVDAGIKKIKADMSARQEISADNFLHNRTGRIIEENDMITVPADAAADVEQDSRHELKHGGDLVGEILSRMKVARVQ